MQLLRHHLMDMRTSLTMPIRERRLRQLAAAGVAPMSVLFYHRVADVHPTAWTISNKEFERHIDYCREHSSVISLHELQRRSRKGFNHEPTISITFDDGYAENCRFAIPYLIRHQVPCTYFVTIENLRYGKPFQHDIARKQILPVNTFDEVRAMADGGIEIGLHTRSHFDFSKSVSESRIREEITTACEELSDVLKRPVRYFAFPFGLPRHLIPAAIDAVREAGMVGYCSAYGAYNFPGDDPFHIRRFHGDPQFHMFRNWMTFDENKVQKEKAIQKIRLTTSSEKIRRPLKTMFIITSMPVGGAETLLVNMLDRFDPERIKPEVVCLKEPGPLGDKIADRHIVHSRLLEKKWDVSILPRLSRLMRDRQIDAVVTVGAGDKMFWGRLAANRAGVPVVCSALHSTGWPDGIGKLNRLLTKITDGFIAVADHHGEYLSQHEDIPEERVHIVRNGIDCDRFVPDKRARVALRKELALDQKTRVVGIVAALRPEKNHAMFVDVAKLVCTKRDDVHFVIVGDGPERSSVEASIAKHGLTDKVHLLGTRHDTPQICAGLDLFLLCSHNEASPVSILESLACEVPVVSTRVGSVAETVVDGETGFLVDKDDRDSMAWHVLALLENEGMREQLGSFGRDLVLKMGSLDSMVAGYTDLIESIYDQKRGVEGVSKQRASRSATMAASNCDFQEVY